MALSDLKMGADPVFKKAVRYGAVPMINGFVDKGKDMVTVTSQINFEPLRSPGRRWYSG